MNKQWGKGRSRASFMTLMAATGTAVGLVGISKGEVSAEDIVPGPCDEQPAAILNAALVVERLALTLYYTGLTSKKIVRHPQLGGSSSNPLDPGLPPNGTPANVHYLQAALDAEMKHIDVLVKAGAASPVTSFHFPAATFTTLGTSLQPTSFLGAVDAIETVLIGLYATAVSQFVVLQQPDLATLSARLMGVESEHHTLGRVISKITLPSDRTLERISFACASDALAVLSPYVSGHGFTTTPIQTAVVPKPDQVAHVVGKYGTRIVRRYL